MIGSERLNVVCVLRSGGDYDAEYVERLQAGVTKHLPIDHRFICLSDIAVPCERIPLKHNWPGWWSKIEIFRLPPPVLYFDLDTIIVGNILDIAEQADNLELTLLRDFYRENGIGSGMIGFGLPVRHIYDEFAHDPDGWMQQIGGRGDQGFLEKILPRNSAAKWQTQLPGQVVSYKSHVRKAENIRESGNGAVPVNARVICFHGHPRPRDVRWLDA